jgi:hypothetical protein
VSFLSHWTGVIFEPACETENNKDIQSMRLAEVVLRDTVAGGQRVDLLIYTNAKPFRRGNLRFDPIAGLESWLIQYGLPWNQVGSPNRSQAARLTTSPAA